MDLSAELAAVSIGSVDDVRSAAEGLRDAALRIADMRVAVCDNIASKATMVDADGNILAADVFGWTGDDERWWADTRLALSSPLPRACRYEAEPFWANASGFRTRQRCSRPKRSGPATLLAAPRSSRLPGGRSRRPATSPPAPMPTARKRSR